jgi:hypothetical protein
MIESLGAILDFVDSQARARVNGRFPAVYATTFINSSRTNKMADCKIRFKMILRNRHWGWNFLKERKHLLQR